MSWSFDFQLRYCKGRYNVVVDALTSMHAINSLSLTKVENSVLDTMRGKRKHDQSNEQVWLFIVEHDYSHFIVACDVDSYTLSSSLSSDKLNFLE